MSVKYDLKKSKDVLGPLYPRLLDKSGREIDGFHREQSSDDWPTTTLDQIDTDVKYWTARIVANTHRRSISKKERKESIIELAKALRDEGQEGSLVNTINRLTTFSKKYIRKLLPEDFKREKEITLPRSVIKQKPKSKPRKRTTDKEKLDNLYEKVDNSAFSGKMSLSNLKLKAEKLSLDTKPFEDELKKIKKTLHDSIGKRHDEVKGSLNDAYKKVTELKNTLKTQIKSENERREKVKEDLKEEAKEEAVEEAKSQFIEMTEEERITDLLKGIPSEFDELKSWAIEGYWGTEAILDLLKKPTARERIKAILETGDSELKQRVKEGKTSVIYAYKKLIREKKHQTPPPLPEGKYDVIYADPPWQYDIPIRGAPDMHYPTMTLEDICNLKHELPIAEDTILFLWATNPKLQEALQTMVEWGFTYKTNLSWVKDKIGTGYYFRGKHELLLVGIKGNMPPPIEANRPPSVLTSARREHSQKPEEVYEIIETMYPNRKYLELFARNNRKDWEVWGNEQL